MYENFNWGTFCGWHVKELFQHQVPCNKKYIFLEVPIQWRIVTFLIIVLQLPLPLRIFSFFVYTVLRLFIGTCGSWISSGLYYWTQEDGRSLWQYHWWSFPWTKGIVTSVLLFHEVLKLQLLREWKMNHNLLMLSQRKVGPDIFAVILSLFKRLCFPFLFAIV